MEAGRRGIRCAPAHQRHPRQPLPWKSLLVAVPLKTRPQLQPHHRLRAIKVKRRASLPRYFQSVARAARAPLAPLADYRYMPCAAARTAPQGCGEGYTEGLARPRRDGARRNAGILAGTLELAFIWLSEAFFLMRWTVEYTLEFWVSHTDILVFTTTDTVKPVQKEPCTRRKLAWNGKFLRISEIEDPIPDQESMS